MLNAYKRGLIAGCRPIIALDDCHLKGPYGGHLLCVVGIGGNDDMFPIAFVVIEIEFRDSWTCLWSVYYIALVQLRSVDGYYCLIDRR